MYVWMYVCDVKADYVSPPVVGVNGLIYFGTRGRFYEDAGSLKALYPNSQVAWEYNFGSGGIWRSPAIGEDGTIYVYVSDGKLYAISSSGDFKWDLDLYISSYRTGGSSVNIGSNGNIFLSIKFSYFAVSPSGVVLWQRNGAQDQMSGCAADRNGNLYVKYRHTVCSLKASDGSDNWCVTVAEPAGSYEVALSPNELSLYFNAGGRIISLRTFDGTQNGETSVLGCEFVTSVGWDGKVYAACGVDGLVYAFSSSLNTILWTFQMETSRYTDSGRNAISFTNIVIGQSTIYVAEWGGNFYALNIDGSFRWVLNNYIYGSGMAVSADGTVYINALARYLYAIGGCGQLCDNGEGLSTEAVTPLQDVCSTCTNGYSGMSSLCGRDNYEDNFEGSNCDSGDGDSGDGGSSGSGGDDDDSNVIVIVIVIVVVVCFACIGIYFGGYFFRYSKRPIQTILVLVLKYRHL
jgi:outer membrane protein assembly factor BamB